MSGPGEHLRRWPLLLASVTLIGLGTAVAVTDATGAAEAAVLFTLGTAAFGAFVYAEGARHRDWNDRD